MDGTECLSSKNMQGIWLISKSEMLNLELRWSENFEGTSNFTSASLKHNVAFPSIRNLGNEPQSWLVEPVPLSPT